MTSVWMYFLPYRRLVPLYRIKNYTLSVLKLPSKILTRKDLIKKGLIASIAVPFLHKNFKPNTLQADNFLKNIIEHADDLYGETKFEELLDFLVKYKDERNAEILWRLARATYEKGRKSTVTAEKHKLYKEALDFLSESLALDENNFASHKWMAIVLDCYYTLEGIKARVSHLYEMKTHMEKACELKPNDGTSWFVLGMWYFGVANLSWYERKGAAIFFATPPEAKYEEALEIFLKAEEIEPNFYSRNLLMIGKCFYHLGKKDEAKDYLLRAQKYTLKTLDDHEAREEAKELLMKL